MHGYSLALVHANRAAPKNKLGVRLGRVCIQANIPVAKVAADFKVSRQTIYTWFCGRGNPHWQLEDAIEEYITKLV